MQNEIPQIFIKRGREKSLKKKHHWVFSGGIHLKKGQPVPEEGAFVHLLTHDEKFLAAGHYQQGTIALRILSFKPGFTEEDILRSRLKNAVQQRRSLGLLGRDATSCCRLVHGEGDFLPGLIIDWYNGLAVVQCHSRGMLRVQQQVAEILREELEDTLDCVYAKNEGAIKAEELKEELNRVLWGSLQDKVVQENHLKFEISPENAQKTGFFIDQRDNRRKVQEYSAGRSVLNICSYTAGFSVYAMEGGAKKVHSVDLSSEAIAQGDRNMELNFPGETGPGLRHESFAEDAFQFFQSDHFADGKAPYDLIILDPPSFAKHKSAKNNARRGYMRLNRAAMRHIPSGGLIFTFSCSQAFTPQDFRDAVLDAARQSGRSVKVIETLSQPADHPVNMFHPESGYLKGLLLYVE